MSTLVSNSTLLIGMSLPIITDKIILKDMIKRIVGDKMITFLNYGILPFDHSNNMVLSKPQLLTLSEYIKENFSLVKLKLIYTNPVPNVISNEDFNIIISNIKPFVLKVYGPDKNDLVMFGNFGLVYNNLINSSITKHQFNADIIIRISLENNLELNQGHLLYYSSEETEISKSKKNIRIGFRFNPGSIIVTRGSHINESTRIITDNTFRTELVILCNFI